MTQATNFGVPRNGPKSPTDMYTQIDENLDAAISNHSGSSRPSYAVAGTIWADTSVSGTTIMKFFDGSNDREIYRVDSSGKFTYPNLDFNGADITGISTLNNAALGRWNWIINGDFSENIRNAATKAQAVGVYGYDRWKGHADGLEQVVDIPKAGEYTLLWEGGGSGTFNGTTATSPIKETISAGSHSVIVPSDADNICLFKGDATKEASPFISRPAPIERILCEWYYREIGDGGLEFPINLVRVTDGNNAYHGGINFQKMRDVPSAALVNTSIHKPYVAVEGLSSVTIEHAKDDSLHIQVVPVTNHAHARVGRLTAGKLILNAEH